VPEPSSPAPGSMNIYRNPFIVALWAPIYLFFGALAITNDFLMATMFIMLTLGVLGAYVTEFPLLPTLYMNEVAHKTSVSSLAGILIGLMLYLISTSLSNVEGTESISAQGKLMITWGVLALPAYPLMAFLISRVNKRDLDAEQKIRDEKNKERRKRGGGPPIMDKPGF